MTTAQLLAQLIGMGARVELVVGDRVVQGLPLATQEGWYLLTGAAGRPSLIRRGQVGSLSVQPGLVTVTRR